MDSFGNLNKKNMTKKIMFSDKYGLTQAVIEGRKTQTRRVVSQSLIDKYDEWYDDVCTIAMPPGSTIETLRDWLLRKHTRYRAGEVVAVAQSYCSIAEELENCNNATCAAHYEKNVQKSSEYIWWMEHPGFYNKMFVAADMMIHQIRITDVRVERLQDISDEDCLKEGVRKVVNENGIYVQYYVGKGDNACSFENPREAFAHLINKVSRKDVWAENPYVFVYDFELVNSHSLR